MTGVFSGIFSLKVLLLEVSLTPKMRLTLNEFSFRLDIHAKIGYKWHYVPQW